MNPFPKFPCPLPFLPFLLILAGCGGGGGNFSYELEIGSETIPCDLSVLSGSVEILSFDAATGTWEAKAKKDLKLVEFFDGKDFIFQDEGGEAKKKNGCLPKPLKDLASGDTFTLVMEGFKRVKSIPEGAVKVVLE